MIQATIVITIKYAPDADMEEAVSDKVGFEKEFRNYFAPSIARMEDLHIDHTISEVTEIK